MLLRIAAALTLLLVVPVQTVDACSCMRAGPPCEAVWKAGAVFSGEVLEIAPFHFDVKPGEIPPPLGSLRVTIRVDRPFRGVLPEVIDVHTGEGDADCGFPFRVGGRYLVYAHEIAGQLQASVCSRTRRLSDATEDLTYLEALSKPSGVGRVFGTLTAPGTPRQPVPGVRVRLGNESGERSTVTDANGAFEFPFLPPGGYGIQPDVPDTHLVRGPAYVEIPDPRACVAADYSVEPDGRVSLFLLEHDGRPARGGATLELIRAESLHQATPDVRPMRPLADGSVTWAQLRPGRYVIGLNITLPPDPRRPQVSLFYPGTADRAGAHEFELGVGERVELDTMFLPPPPERLAITGVVVDERGAPVSGATVSLRSASPFARRRMVDHPLQTDRWGRFRVWAVAGHRYLIVVRGLTSSVPHQSDEFELTPLLEPLRIVLKER